MTSLPKRGDVEKELMTNLGIGPGELALLYQQERAFDLRWYEGGYGDESGYSDPTYLAIGVKTHYEYSRGSMKSTLKFLPETPKSMVDYGAGCGLCCIQMKLVEPKCEVIYTGSSDQEWQFAQILMRQYGVDVKHAPVPDDLVGPVDLACFFELAEHLQDLDPLLGWIERVRPQWLSFASSFGSLAYGHWKDHLVGGKMYTSLDTARPFNKALVKLGYKTIGHGWNSRPRVWEIT